MALSTTTNKVIHSGNASATVFPFTFPIPDASYLSVIYTSAAGVETTLSPSLYSATGIGTTTGGSVTYPLSGSPIAASTLLTLVRTVPYTQTTVMANQGGYYPEVVEAVFDRLTMEIQQLAEIVGRVTVSSISNPATEQSNYALIQTLQTFQTGIDKLTTAGDMLSHNGSAYVRLARGAANTFPVVTGTALAFKGLVVTTQTFSANGTYTPSTGMIYCIIEAVGGGGGGGGVNGTGANSAGAGGGGAGGYALLLATAATIGASQSVTIGASGAGGTAGANNGSAGGDTSVGSLCIGKGGSGGGFSSPAGSVWSGSGGAGGVAGTGTTALPGVSGFSGVGEANTQMSPFSGAGGSSPFGGGGRSVTLNTSTTTAGNAATANTGGGGGGAISFNNAATAAGGAGGSGYVRITEFCIQ